MKIERAEDAAVTAVFEADPVTEFSEHFVAMNALGSYTLLETHDRSYRLELAQLAIRIRSTGAEVNTPPENPADKPKPKDVPVAINDAEAAMLTNALHHYKNSADFDIANYGMARNYSGICSQIIEDDMAISMASGLQEQLGTHPDVSQPKPSVGFSS